MTEEKASELMLKAFHTASRFESLCSVGRSAESLRKDLLECLDYCGWRASSGTVVNIIESMTLFCGGVPPAVYTFTFDDVL